MTSGRRAFTYLALVFLLGGLVGSLATHWAHMAGWVEAASQGMREQKRSPVQWLTDELDLTPDQQRQLELILDETAAGYRAIRKRVRPEYDEVRQAGRERIRAILSEEQLPQFEELVRRIDQERRRRQHKE